MSRLSSTGILAALTTLAFSPLAAQERSRLGINLSVGAVQQVGLTYAITSAVELRPAAVFDWRRLAPSTGANPVIVVAYGAGLDVLLLPAGHEAARPYLGVGTSYVLNQTNGLNGSTGHTLGGSGFFGVRVRVLPRVHLYGEATVSYSSFRAPNQPRVDQILLRTTPLAVLVYLW